MIFSDRAIKDSLRWQTIGVTPYEEAAVQPASLDLRLGRSFKVFAPGHRLLDPAEPVGQLMDSVTTDLFVLKAGQFALGVTKERIRLTERICARVEGKSSLGRLGLTVHSTAGFIDPGFDGYVTLELYNQSPCDIILRSDMWICQIAFEWMTSACKKPYNGRYTDQTTPEAVASRVDRKLA